jgi:hypothetical protein
VGQGSEWKKVKGVLMLDAGEARFSAFEKYCRSWRQAIILIHVALNRHARSFGVPQDDDQATDKTFLRLNGCSRAAAANHWQALELASATRSHRMTVLEAPELLQHFLAFGGHGFHLYFA